MELTPEQKGALNVAHYLAGVLSGSCKTGNTLEDIANGCALSIEKTLEVLTTLVDNGHVYPCILMGSKDENKRKYELVQESLPIVINTVTNLLAMDDAEKCHKEMKGPYEEMKEEVEAYELMRENVEKGFTALMSPREGSQ